MQGHPLQLYLPVSQLKVFVAELTIMGEAGFTPWCVADMLMKQVGLVGLLVALFPCALHSGGPLAMLLAYTPQCSHRHRYQRSSWSSWLNGSHLQEFTGDE